MAGSKETPIPITETYRSAIRAAVIEAGGQTEVDRQTGIDQGTISRLINGAANTSYATLLKLAEFLRLPPPIVAVRDADHETWCTVGARLAADKPTLFGTLLQSAVEAAASPPPPRTFPDATPGPMRPVHKLPSRKPDPLPDPEPTPAGRKRAR